MGLMLGKGLLGGPWVLLSLLIAVGINPVIRRQQGYAWVIRNKYKYKWVPSTWACLRGSAGGNIATRIRHQG